MDVVASTVGPAQLTIRDLKLIDGTMTQIAEALGLTVTDYDTVPAGRVHGHRGGTGSG